MNNQPSCEQLRSELRRRGLPRAYIERLLAELDDHFADLLEERSTSMGAARKLQFESDTAPDDLQARLGNPTQLAIFAADQYHAQNFLGRHPVLTFLLAPLPLLVAMWCVYWVGIVAPVALSLQWIVRTIGWGIEVHEHPWTQAIALVAICWGLIVLPPLASASLLCRVARRNSLDRRWPVVSCCLLAIVAALFAVSWRLATGPSAAERGQFTIGFDFDASPSWLLLRFLPKFALALGIGLLLVRRARDQLQCGT